MMMNSRLLLSFLLWTNAMVVTANVRLFYLPNWFDWPSNVNDLFTKKERRTHIHTHTHTHTQYTHNTQEAKILRSVWPGTFSVVNKKGDKGLRHLCIVLLKSLLLLLPIGIQRAAATWIIEKKIKKSLSFSLSPSLPPSLPRSLCWNVPSILFSFSKPFGDSEVKGDATDHHSWLPCVCFS